MENRSSAHSEEHKKGKTTRAYAKQQKGEGESVPNIVHNQEN